MIEYFADTFYYLALVNPADAAHGRAENMSLRLTGRLVTTAWIVQELADGLSSPPRRAIALRLLTSIEQDPQTVVIEPSVELWRRGLSLYRSRLDKEWSLTDCISFVVMQQRGITEALTGDQHFEQAGFVAMLRLRP